MNNKSSKDKNEQKNDELNSSQKQKQSQIENAAKHSNSKDQVDIVTKKKLKMQQWLPKDSLETITTFVKERYSSQEARVDVLGKICDKVLNAKDEASINDKAYKVLRWERNPYLVKEVNNKMHYWLTTAIMNSKKSWWGYFYTSLKNCFDSIVEETLSDKAPEPSKHSKNQKGSNGRKHIQEKIPYWAKDGYKPNFKKVSPEYKSLMDRKVKLTKDDSEDHSKEISDINSKLKEMKQNNQEITSDSSNNTQHSKENNDNTNNKTNNPVSNKRKFELKGKLKGIGNPMTEKKENKQPKVHNQDKGDFKITPEMMAKANNLNETSNDTSKNDKSPSEALADIGLE